MQKAKIPKITSSQKKKKLKLNFNDINIEDTINRIDVSSKAFSLVSSAGECAHTLNCLFREQFGKELKIFL